MPSDAPEDDDDDDLLQIYISDSHRKMILRIWSVSIDSKEAKKIFLDAFSHHYKRVCLSIRPSVGPPLGLSVGLSIGPSVTDVLNF